MEMNAHDSEWAGFFQFIPTKVFYWLLNSPCRTTCLFTGNQKGKNEDVNMDYLLRCMGRHPKVHKNIMPQDAIKTMRFASQTLPSEKAEEEVKNTQYPALKRRIPQFMVEQDITVRRPVVTVNCLSGAKAQLEFVSFGQDVQSGAGVQRRSCWIDEECTRDFYEEQIPRLLAADGDIIFSFTPVPGAIEWEFDELYERARMIYRTEVVRKRIRQRFGEEVPEMQVTDSKDDICVIIAATDDNPIYERLAKEKGEREGRIITASEYVDDMFNMYDDEDVIDARRYGLFRQLSGKIYKSFGPTQIISLDKYLPEGIPHEWKHFRGIDYHQANPWACLWVSVSPQDEIFVWKEYAPVPGRIRTWDIAMTMATISGDYRFLLDLIDPLANEVQINTNMTTVQDLNDYFWELKKRGVGTGAHWAPWDTKGTRGREELTKRLINSIKCRVPFNNKQEIGKDHEKRAVYLPTIWISDSCKNTIESMKSWRMEEWSSREMLSRNDPKERAQRKWSHFPMCLESMLKNPEVSNARWGSMNYSSPRPKYYGTRRY